MIASARAAGGVRIAPRTCGAKFHPSRARITDRLKKNEIAVPITRLTSLRSPAPTDWAIMMLAAIVAPKMAPWARKPMTLALPMAAIAVTPSKWLTQNWFAVRFSD